MIKYIFVIKDTRMIFKSNTINSPSQRDVDQTHRPLQSQRSSTGGDQEPLRMFVVVEMIDTVRIPPWNFHRQLNDAIAEELNKKLANKVVYNVGLCICLYDITKLEDSYIFPGDGASHTKVHFRYVVFHPFLDEVMVGKIKYCSQEGVYVSLGFFDDILIPPESLQQPAKFDEAEQVWVWEYETDEGAHDLYMDQGEDIRFRVVDEFFLDTSPTGPTKEPEAPAQTASAAPATATDDGTQKKESPYTLVASITDISTIINNNNNKPIYVCVTPPRTQLVCHCTHLASCKGNLRVVSFIQV
ncbi:hypothetical protein AMELA_G00174620 [Ameiurus melas]|uniref:DNA-directed RNA polymerase subunit n=1 Tax=Ameiurus melas TaxID=219545 RepID=A0A7J6ACZ3_AMEME|nr:hypothetical protein AMELA_G00174620 [Ameiurus melas]